MICIVKYFIIICLFGLGLLGFNIFINIHIFTQLFSNFLCKEFEEHVRNYDYIIVGSGTAGSIMALRLAQLKTNKVLLLEAGPYSNLLFDIPVLTPMLHKSDVDWQYVTVPQKHACKAMINNASSWPMGKIFGGTHRINNMVHTRGHRSDFDDWYKNKSDYNYEEDVLYYFKKAENWMSMDHDGPLHVNSLNFVSQLGEAVLDAAEYLGFPIKNVNTNPGTGFMKPYITTRNNKRWTTSHSLLERKYKNLKIITSAYVNKILFKNNYEASGVQFSFLGDTKIVRAKKAVILSAGVIGTPKILLSSGVGPAKHLSNIKIRSRVDLPVGENLQDHITTGLDLIILNETLTISLESLVSPISLFKYFLYNSGPWVTVGCEAIGFCHTNFSLVDIKPNLQFMVVPVGVSTDAGKHFKNVLGIKHEIWSNYFASLIGKQVVSILPIVLHPKSRGTVRLKSNFDVEIDPNYLSNKNDVEILLHGIKVIKSLVKTPAMQKLGARLNTTPFPGCKRYKFDTKNYWECYIKQFTLTSFHPCGTCKMGTSDAVVDYNFKVLGTNKLYIVDGSVIPLLPSGNPNSIIAMLAEKAADIIKNIQYLTEKHCKKIHVFLEENICVL